MMSDENVAQRCLNKMFAVQDELVRQRDQFERELQSARAVVDVARDWFARKPIETMAWRAELEKVLAAYDNVRK